ncbi:hypothetical protein RRG08_018291 [Elysia crispata]|uniref:Uncharacterized protein n=1 Tax=Elysia crispata TaxID=231223 RepID=A0AAE1B6B3_9GAST|nr:hypothetical protein RRG08_018291 [Elysia crispata]
MREAEIVLVLFRSEPKSRFFDELLGHFPSVFEQREDNPNPPQLLAARIEEGVHVPARVSEHGHVLPTPLGAKVAALNEYCEQLVTRRSFEPGDPFQDTQEQDAEGVDHILSLFCFLISTSWPLTELKLYLGNEYHLDLLVWVILAPFLRYTAPKRNRRKFFKISQRRSRAIIKEPSEDLELLCRSGRMLARAMGTSRKPHTA